MDAWITSTIGWLGYTGVAILMFLENVFPPLPSELIMPLAGFTAQRGELSLEGVIAAGSAGSVAGQFPLYWLGRVLGEGRLHRFADRYGKWVTLSGHHIDRAGQWFRRRGPWALFFCRLIPGVRSFVSIPAGASHMSLPLFTLYSAMGISLWNSLLAGSGYLLGHNYDRVQHDLGRFGNAVWLLIAAALVAWIVWRLRGCLLHASADCPWRDAPEHAKRKSHSRT